MPPKNWKAKKANRARNEFNEFAPDFKPLAKETETETADVHTEVIQIAQAVRVLVSPDIGDRDK